MANLVKKKLRVIVPLTILLLIILIISYFVSDNSNRYKTWSPENKLSMSDFLGTGPILFNDFDAHIVTNIKLTNLNDSVFAETTIDTHKSWYSNIEENEDLISHEKYHANITEIATREINEILHKYKFNKEEIRKLRNSVGFENSKLQSLYDIETEHSLNNDLQHYWEYKIDSMLNKRIDYFENNLSNGQVFFPNRPIIKFTCYSDALTKSYYLKKNEIDYEFLIMHDFTYGLDTIYHREYLESKNLANINIKMIELENLTSIISKAIDTVNNLTKINVIIPSHNRSYHLTVSYPESLMNEIMANQFIYSFKINKSNIFWKKYYNTSINPISIENTQQENGNDLLYFNKSHKSDYSITYSDPFEYDKNLLIPFNIIRHNNNQIEQTLLILNDSLKFTNDIDSLYQYIPLNTKFLKEGSNKIQIGYITKKTDSTELYNDFYGTIIQYNK